MSKVALVTGDEGLVGRHVAAELENRGFFVDGHDIKTGYDSRRLLPGIDSKYDLVVHCAAHVGGRKDIDGRPGYVAAINTQLDGALLEFALRTRPHHVIYWSSSAVYPVALQTINDPWKLAEHHVNLQRPRVADASYGAVKFMGEQMAAWAESEGVRFHVFRPFSGYASDQDLTYPFPSFIERAKRRDDPFEIWGTGRQVRDFVHIDDVVNCALAAVEQDYRGPLNVCSGEGVSFIDLARMMSREVGYEPKLNTVPDAPTGVHYRVGNPTEMLKVYTPKIPLDEGIKQALNT